MQELIEEIEEIMDDEEEAYWTQRKEIILQLLKNIEDNIDQLKETRYFLGYSKLTTSNSISLPAIVCLAILVTLPTPWVG